MLTCFYTNILIKPEMSVTNALKSKAQPKVALIVGASGLVGQHLLSQLLASKNYSQVIALVRKPLDVNHNKLIQKQVDFNNLAHNLTQLTKPNNGQEKLDLNEDYLPKIDHVFCTLGSTIKKAGSKSAFKQVDYLYPLLIAKHFYQENASLFCVVTAMAANESSAIFYNQVKGQLESAICDIGYQHLGIFRPSMLSGQRNEYRLGEQFGTLVMNALAFMLPKKYRVIKANKVANAMLAYAEHPPLGITITQSDQLQNY